MSDAWRRREVARSERALRSAVKRLKESDDEFDALRALARTASLHVDNLDMLEGDDHGSDEEDDEG